MQDYELLLKGLQTGVTNADAGNALLAQCFDAITDLLKMIPKDRTEKQSSSRWIYLSQIAKQLNDRGIDRQVLLTQLKETAAVSAQHNRETLYDDYWKPVHKALYPSVKRLSTTQIQDVYESMNEHAGRVFGCSAAWPDQFNRG